MIHSSSHNSLEVIAPQPICSKECHLYKTKSSVQHGAQEYNRYTPLKAELQRTQARLIEYESKHNTEQADQAERNSNGIQPQSRGKGMQGPQSQETSRLSHLQSDSDFAATLRRWEAEEDPE